LTPVEVSQIVTSLNPPIDIRVVRYTIGKIIGEHMLIGWTTTGHTSTDVGFYALGNLAAGFQGNVKNIAVAEFVSNILTWDLTAITDALNFNSNDTNANGK